MLKAQKTLHDMIKILSLDNQVIQALLVVLQFIFAIREFGVSKAWVTNIEKLYPFRLLMAYMLGVT